MGVFAKFPANDHHCRKGEREEEDYERTVGPLGSSSGGGAIKFSWIQKPFSRRSLRAKKRGLVLILFTRRRESREDFTPTIYWTEEHLESKIFHIIVSASQMPSPSSSSSCHPRSSTSEPLFPIAPETACITVDIGDAAGKTTFTFFFKKKRRREFDPESHQLET